MPEVRLLSGTGAVPRCPTGMFPSHGQPHLSHLKCLQPPSEEFAHRRPSGLSMLQQSAGDWLGGPCEASGEK